MNNTDYTYSQTDFSHQDLSGQIFTQCKFYCCSFKRANLRDTQFIDCVFIEPGAIEGCDFSYSDLRDASFKQCRISMSSFKGANCFGVELRDCDLKGADFAQASFVNHVSNKMYFCSAYITGCNLSYVNFEKQCIEKCDLFENRWIGANLRGASFKESDLSRGVFSEDCWELPRIQGCDLTHSELYGLDPRKVDLTGVKICAWQQEQLLEQLGLIIVPD
ncbi:MAG: Qnr family pentapeptide repeat protein [Vibrio gallaecicus]|uniref:Qnr family pentapeptide repeat protein n=1 Tax=Vibrio gallaecicus TaxID=552386 RepID=A0ABV4NBR8_9VIBR|nr:Qnr family pentapeptide repeat protein [Vibrio gallaecicus]MDN3616429.1 Qnr family pentapeptide repeat protein [Vibrio gallaecicus]